ncbi:MULTISPECIES: ElyC/SanA/YdcF family protein [unclassified Butyrivibrio]|uniref:ElyC/SanA/YdcF family protein n=1 Tax=unclassified Butyrivibrio TaxID=2639466 RepID=UPI0009DE2005|nr:MULTISPECIES: ElyC/SanA/YdcF family protein [unclassified Butyrivibrio]
MALKINGMVKMTYRIIALFFMFVFYGIYFTKMMLQKKKGIVTDQIAKGKSRDKGYYIELTMKIATYLAPLAEVISIVLGTVSFPLMFRIIGMYFAFVGDIVFFTSVYTMRDSWRAGVAEDDKEKRNLVTTGIYNYSRNPAFLGFNLVYTGILLMFFNPVLLVISVFAMVMLHLQILREEKFLEKTYGSEYTQYKGRTSRYAGMGRPTPSKILMYIYFVLTIWSVLYYFTCLAYGGGLTLSWVWLWLIIAAFSALRVFMLKRRIDGREKKKLPAAVKWIYRVVFTVFLTYFAVTEVKIIRAMSARPKENLDYIIVLGAGLKGTEPSNQYKARIRKAAEYLDENENTKIIASGGQGNDEEISEAECAKRKLVSQYGIDESRIIPEEKSTDTEENLRYSLEIIGDPTISTGIVTNGFHELRAMSIAKREGYKNVYSVPAKTLFPCGIHYVVREFFGMTEFYIKNIY